MIAYGVHRAAMELGLKVPGDVILMGFDDNRLNDWLAPWLSTVTVPAFDYGPAIAQLIEYALKEKTTERNIILPFKIKIRQSA